MPVRPEDAGIVGIEFVFATPDDRATLRTLQTRRDYRAAEEYRSALYLTLDNGSRVRIALPARFEEYARETLAAQLDVPGFARYRTDVPTEEPTGNRTGNITADEFEAAVARISARMVPRPEPIPSQADFAAANDLLAEALAAQSDITLVAPEAQVPDNPFRAAREQARIARQVQLEADMQAMMEVRPPPLSSTDLLQMFNEIGNATLVRPTATPTLMDGTDRGRDLFPRFVKKNRAPTPVPVERVFVSEADLDPYVRRALQKAPPGHWVGNKDQAFRYDADGPEGTNVEIGKPGPGDALKVSFSSKPNAWRLLTDPPVPAPPQKREGFQATFHLNDDQFVRTSEPLPVEQHIEDAANRCNCPACQRTGRVLDRQRARERGWILYSETRGVQREDLTTVFYPTREAAEQARNLRGLQGLVVAQAPEYWAISHRGHRQFMLNDAPEPSVAIFPNYDSAVAAMPPEGMIIPYPALWAIVREDGYPLYADSTETTLRTWTSDDAAAAYARGLMAEERFNWRVVPADEALPPAPRALPTDRWILRNLNGEIFRSMGIAQVFTSFERALSQSEIRAARGEAWRIERPGIWTLRNRHGGQHHTVQGNVVPYNHYVEAMSAANLLHDAVYDPEPGYPE